MSVCHGSSTARRLSRLVVTARLVTARLSRLVLSRLVCPGRSVDNRTILVRIEGHVRLSRLVYGSSVTARPILVRIEGHVRLSRLVLSRLVHGSSSVTARRHGSSCHGSSVQADPLITALSLSA
jgi:hypothetical protein